MAGVPEKRRRSIWDPFSELENLREEMNRLFDFSRTKWPEKSGSFIETGWSPSIDVYEDKNNVTVEADLPGLKKEDISVSVKGDSVVMKGHKKSEKKETKENFVRSERTYGSFYRQIPVPAGTDPDKIDAEYKNGVLKLTMPKKEEAKQERRDIDIK